MSDTLVAIEWPVVWAQYWRKLTQEEEDSFEASLADIFSNDIEDPQKGEVATALRALGESGLFTQYPPKLGVISAKIKERRKKLKEDSGRQEYSRRGGTYKCGYCKDKGWFNVPFVYGINGKATRPKLITELVPFERTGTGEMRCYKLVRLEIHNAQQVPCTFCGKNNHMIEGDTQRMRDAQNRVKSWMLRLPDECMDKLDILRSKSWNPEIVTTTELKLAPSNAPAISLNAEALSGWTTDEFSEE